MCAIRGNSISFGGKFGVVLITKVIVILTVEISVNSSGNYSMSSNMEVDASSNPEDAEVCLDALLAIITNPASSQLNIVVPIFPIYCGYPTPVSFIV